MLTPQEQLRVILKGVQQCVNEDELLQKLENSYRKNKPLIIKLGLDPSAPDIHLGHAVVLRKIKQMQQAMTGMDVDNLLQKIDNSLGIPVLSAQVEAENMETLREYLDHIRGKLPSGIIFLGTVSGGKVLLAAAITKDLNKEGLHAGKLVGEIAKLTGGGGGGRPDLAQAGGKDPDKLPHALSQVLPIIKKQRAGSSLK